MYCTPRSCFTVHLLCTVHSSMDIPQLTRSVTDPFTRDTRSSVSRTPTLSSSIMTDDYNPRPQKRPRTDHIADNAEPPAPLPSSSSSQPPSTFRPLPPPVLLLALPALLTLPPSHEHYALSLFLSLKALRTCLELKILTPDVECRAWTGIAELGLRVINSGFAASGEHAWMNGIEADVSSPSVMWHICSYIRSGMQGREGDRKGGTSRLVFSPV